MVLVRLACLPIPPREKRRGVLRAAPFALLGCMLCGLLCLAACDRPAEIYAPPEQRHPVAGFNPGPDALMVEMNQPDASLFIAKDIYGQSDPSWRWTGQNPTVQLLAPFTENLKFHTDFAIWDEGFKTTGPVEIAYLVNGRTLDKVRYTSPGVKHFDKPVPADWLSVESDTTVAMYIDKVNIAPTDGAKLGVILLRLGLKQ